MTKRLMVWFVIVLSSLLLLSCPTSTGPTIYERIVIDIYPPVPAGEPDTEIALFDKDGSTELAKDESGSPGPPGLIDTEVGGLSLSSGTYFIKVYHENPAGGLQPYVVRAISLALGVAIPLGTDDVPAIIPDYDADADTCWFVHIW